MENINYKKILFYSGTFDPIHYGHSELFKAAINYVKPDLIYFSVDNYSPWKNNAFVAPYTYRLKMAQILLSEQNIDYTLYEKSFNSTSSYKTMKQLKDEFPKDEIFFLVGDDEYEAIEKWADYELLKKIVTFVVAGKRSEKCIKRLNQKDYIMSVKLNNYSSTQIRCNVAKSANMTSATVLNFIKQNHLYIEEQVKNRLNEYRFNHTKRVVETIYKIAKGNNFSDEQVLQCYLASFLHDIAKLYDDKKLLTFLTKEQIETLPSVHCAHGLVGAMIAKDEFKVDDEVVLDAIRNHVVYTDTNNIISKTLFCADKLEPARNEQDIPNRENLLNICCKDLEKGFEKVYDLNLRKYQRW